jgi:hypothetical protein
MIMTYLNILKIKSFSKIVLLSIFLLHGCTSINLKSHLKELQKENSQINIKNWDVIQNYSNGVETFYNLQKQIVDTTYFFQFSHFKDGNKNSYITDDFVKSYSVNNSYYEMSLLNNDTLYFFKCNSDSLNENSAGYHKINNLNFVIGKYYFMYRRFRLNSEQSDYFENNMDSLTKIRGNDLPKLPGLPSNDTITILEEKTVRLKKNRKFKKSHSF